MLNKKKHSFGYLYYLCIQHTYMENKSTYFICEVPSNHLPLIFPHSSSLSLPDRSTVSGRLGGVEALEYHLHMTVGLGLSRPNTLW